MGAESMFEDEIALAALKKEAARKAAIAEIDAKLAAGPNASDDITWSTHGSKQQAQALQAGVAYAGIEAGNIPKNFKEVTRQGLSYQLPVTSTHSLVSGNYWRHFINAQNTVGRYVNTTITS